MASAKLTVLELHVWRFKVCQKAAQLCSIAHNAMPTYYTHLISGLERDHYHCTINPLAPRVCELLGFEFEEMVLARFVRGWSHMSACLICNGPGNQKYFETMIGF